MIQCKRVYDPPADSDGRRVLVDRLWPRGMKKADLAYDEWCKAVAPSSALRKAFHSEVLDFAAFSNAYLEELAKADEDIRRLAEAGQLGTLTLLYASRDIRHNHAEVLAEYLRSYPQ